MSKSNILVSGLRGSAIEVILIVLFEKVENFYLGLLAVLVCLVVGMDNLNGLVGKMQSWMIMVVEFAVLQEYCFGWCGKCGVE